MSINHPTTEELFEAHIKQVEGERAREIHKHLEACESCRQALLDFESLEETFKKETLEQPSTALLEAIRRRAGQVMVKKQKPGFFWLLAPSRAVGLVMAVLIVAGLGLFYKYGFEEESLVRLASSDREVEKVVKKDKKIPSQLPIGGAEELESADVAPPPPAPPAAPAVRVLTAKPQPKERVAFKATRPVSFEEQKRKKRDRYPETVARPRGYRDTSRVGTSVTQILALKSEKAAPAKPAASLTRLPRSELDVSFRRALNLESLRRYEKAEKIFNAIWLSDPNYHQKEKLLFHWAFCLEKLGRKKEAIKKLTLLAKSQPNYPGLQDALTRLK